MFALEIIQALNKDLYNGPASEAEVVHYPPQERKIRRRQLGYELKWEDEKALSRRIVLLCNAAGLDARDRLHREIAKLAIALLDRADIDLYEALEEARARREHLAGC